MKKYQVGRILRSSGFSMIELHIVVTILGVLMAVALFGAPRFINKSQDTRKKNDLEVLRTAFEDYYDDNKCYPDPDAFSNQTNCGKTDTMLKGYTKSFPCDPTTKKPYAYFRINCSAFYLTTILLDENDPAVIQSGCDDGCGLLDAPIGSDDNPNYGVASSNVPKGSRIIRGGCSGSGETVQYCSANRPYNDDSCCSVGFPSVCDSSGTYCVETVGASSNTNPNERRR